MHKRYSAIALCCAAAAVAGCGSSGTSGTGTNAVGLHRPSAQVFSTDLNGLCQLGNAAAAKAAGNPAKILAVINQYLPKFQKLTPSLAQQAVYSKFLANLEKEATALRSGNQSAFQAAVARNGAYAKQLKAPACGRA